MDSSIEQFVDLNHMTMEELIGRLKAHEEWVSCATDEDKHVLLTRALWNAKEDRWGGETSKGRWKKGNHAKGNGREQWRGHNDGERETMEGSNLIK